MTRRRSLLPSGITLLLIVLTGLVSLPAAAEDGLEKVIHISARSFAFDPEVVHVRRGDRVVIELESLDATHGLYLDGYDLSVEAEPGHPARLAFTADRAGSFRFRCSVACGNLHPFMIGQLKVGPNLPFWRALVALGIVTAWGIWNYGRRDGSIAGRPA
jgi:heme/copper-type cytochrome/quinol oxidase subunit 2